jgi:hypothetical protein
MRWYSVNKNIFEMDPLDNPFVYMYGFSIASAMGILYTYDMISGTKTGLFIISAAGLCAFVSYYILGEFISDKTTIFNNEKEKST